MPVAMEQWRVAVGTWNRILTGKPHFDSRLSRRKNKPIMLFFLLLTETTTSLRKWICPTKRVVEGLFSKGNSLFEYIVGLKNDFISIITRLLLIVSGDVELNPGPITMDLRRLLRLLHDVRVKWYDIGIQLSISIGTLDAIKAEHSECGKCLCEMLKYWLNTQQATFDALIEALSSEPVGENTLAENTRDLHLTVTSEKANSEMDPEVVMRDIESKDGIYKELKKYMIDCHWTGKILGRGSFGTVLEMKSGEQFYAGKRYHDIPRSKRQFIVKLYGELLILKKINHPNIVQSVGITFDVADHSPIVLMECMKITLQEYILNNSPTVTVVRKAKLLCDIANGLHFLHSHTPTIIHRDLTANNVLLDASFSVAKISDFGNAHLLDLTSGCTPLSSQPGTLNYMPPEVFEADDYDSSLDVFSFGHLMLFTIIGEIPGRLLGATYMDHNGIQGRSEVERRNHYVVKSHQQLGRNHVLILLMERCLENLPQRRPSAEVLVNTLSHVVTHDDDMDISLLFQTQRQEKQFRATSTSRRKAPEQMDRGAAVSYNGTAYFTPYNSHVLYKYQMDNDEWIKLPLCPQANFGLAIIKTFPTAIGGIQDDTPTNALTSFDGVQWIEKFPPMITPRSRSAVVSTADGAYVVAAGGWGHDGDWWTDVVEYYCATAECWARLINMPLRLPGISAALCGDQLYLLDWGDSIYTCSLQDLIKTSQAFLCSSGDTTQKYLSIWKPVPSIPALWSTPATVCGKLVTVGGHTRPNPTNVIHLYQSGKWTCIGHMSYSRRDSIVAVLHNDTLIVVGGLDPNCTDDVEIVSVTS